MSFTISDIISHNGCKPWNNKTIKIQRIRDTIMEPFVLPEVDSYAITNFPTTILLNFQLGVIVSEPNQK
jgi:hypothetical protein